MKSFSEFITSDNKVDLKSFLTQLAKKIGSDPLWNKTAYDGSSIAKFLKIRVNNIKKSARMGNNEYSVNFDPLNKKITCYSINQNIGAAIFAPAIEKIAKELGIKIKLEKSDYYFVWKILD